MPALSDPRHEKFAQELSLANKPQVDCYAIAGFKPDRGNAKRLANKAFVKARVAELRTNSAELAELQLARIQIEKGRIALFNIGDVLKRDAKGVLVLNEQGAACVDLSKMTPAQMAAVAGIDPKTGEIKFYDKNVALNDLFKMIGGAPDESANVLNQWNLFASLSVEDRRTLVAALESVPGGTGEAGAGPAPLDRAG